MGSISSASSNVCGMGKPPSATAPNSSDGRGRSRADGLILLFVVGPMSDCQPGLSRAQWLAALTFRQGVVGAELVCLQLPQLPTCPHAWAFRAVVFQPRVWPIQ